MVWTDFILLKRTHSEVSDDLIIRKREHVTAVRVRTELLHFIFENKKSSKGCLRYKLYNFINHEKF